MGIRDWFGGRKRKGQSEANKSPLQWFAGRVAEALLDRDDVANVEHGDVEGQMRVWLQDGNKHELYVGNVFQESEGSPPEARVSYAVAHFGSMLDATSPDDWESARPLLRVTVGGASGFRVARDARPISELLTDVLAFFPVVDSPATIRYVSAKDIDGWGVDRAELVELAVENMKSLGASFTPYDPDAPNGILMEASDDSFQAARLAVPGLLTELANHVDGKPVAAVPHRDLLLVAGDADSATVGRLCEVAKREYEAGARSISPALYTTDEAGMLAPYPPGDCPAHSARIREAHLHTVAVEYAELKQTLDADFEQDGIDKFVASVMTIENREGVMLSIASWADECDALLPRVDALAIEDGDDIALVPWEEVIRIASGALARHPTYQPPLYETSGPPKETSLRELLVAERLQ